MPADQTDLSGQGLRFGVPVQVRQIDRALGDMAAARKEDRAGRIGLGNTEETDTPRGTSIEKLPCALPKKVPVQNS